MKSTKAFSDELYNKWGLVLNSEYLGAHKPVTFKCNNGHENTAAATNVLQRGYKCKECITGHAVVSKMIWDSKLITSIVNDLSTYTTSEVAIKYSTTESAINNMLAKEGITNPRDRHKEQKLTAVLKTQNRQLINLVGDRATVLCSNGHTITQEPSNILQHNTGCPSCFNLGTSKAEISLIEFIESIYSGWMLTKDRSILEGKELDVVLPDIGLAIEYNGTYWHREEKVGNAYHQDKTNRVEDFGYQLLHIKDYDWVSKQEIVKSMIRSKLGITSKIHARKCVLKAIQFPRDFLETNHIQGAGQPTSKNYGLFHNNELVAVATYAAPRFSDEADLELVRFCSKLNTTVVGGLSKLLLKNVSILSYANRDYSNGKGYLSTGFKLLRVTSPGLEYYYKYEKLSRYKAQSMDAEHLSKYHKYYNAGNLVFIRYA